MFILQTPKPVAFILHPKTGTRSIVEALRLEKPKLVSIGRRHELDEDCIRKIVCMGGLVVGTVRNPYDVLVSWYHYTCGSDRDPPSFLSWVFEFLDGAETGMSHYVSPGQPMFYGYERMNRQIRFENGVHSEYNKILAEVGLSRAVDFPHTGAAHKRLNWQSYYSRKAAQEVYKAFKDDFDRYKYKEHFG